MRPHLLLTLTVLALLGGCASKPEPRPAGLLAPQVNGIALGDREERVLQLLGRPMRRSETPQALILTYLGNPQEVQLSRGEGGYRVFLVRGSEATYRGRSLAVIGDRLERLRSFPEAPLEKQQFFYSYRVAPQDPKASVIADLSFTAQARAGAKRVEAGDPILLIQLQELPFKSL